MKFSKTIMISMGGLMLLNLCANVSGAEPSPVEAKEPIAVLQSTEGLNRLRLNFGYTFVTGDHGLADSPWDLNEITAGFEFSHAFTDQFDLGISANRVFISADSRVYLIGFTPSYGVTQEKFHFYGGLFIGIMDVYNKIYRLVPSPLGTDVTHETVSGTRFAFGPRAGVDYQLLDKFFAHVSVQYVKAFGPDSRLGAFSPLAGVGYDW